MQKSSGNIALCGWESSKVTSEFFTSLQAGDVRVVWGIFDKSLSLPETKIHQLIEDKVIADLSGRTTSFAWQLSLKELSEFDSKIDMIMRVQERWLVGHWNYDDRLFMVHSAIQYFKKILVEKPVDVIFFSTASPHHFYNTVLTVVAESMGIKCIFINFSFISDKFNFVTGVEKFPVVIEVSTGDKTPYVNYLNSLKKVDFRPDYIKAYFNYRASSFLYFLTVIFPKISIKIINGVCFKKSTGLRLFRGKHSFGVAKEIIGDSLNAACELKKMKKFYFDNVTDVVEKDSIIYFANYQPEATSNPDGGKYPDVRYYISTLKSEGKKIYFKEHPTMFNYSNGGWFSDMPRHRSIKYYQDLLNLGVKFIDPKKLTSKLFEDAHCIFSLTGTVAMEASIKGVNTCLAGFSWYGDLPGLVRLNPESKHYPKSQALSAESFLEHFMKIDSCSMDNILGVASAKQKEGTSLKEFAEVMAKVTNKVIGQE